MKDLKDIAITGSAGFIGRYLVEHVDAPWRRLLRHPHQVSRPGDFLGDLNNQHDVETFVEKAGALVHLASVNAPRSSNRDLLYDIESNLLPSVRLLETYAKANPEGHIVFSSSGGAIYAPKPERIPFSEEDRLAPTSSYAIQKLAIENYIHLLHALTGVSATILRISNPYGLPLPRDRAQGVIGIAFCCASNGHEFPLLGSPDTIRDYIHLDDVAELVRIILKRPPPAGVKVYNVGSSVGASVNEVLLGVEKATGKRLTRVHREVQQPAPSWNVLDISAATKEFGWRPSISLEAGLAKMQKRFGDLATR